MSYPEARKCPAYIIVHTRKCPYKNLSVRGNVHTGKCPAPLIPLDLDPPLAVKFQNTKETRGVSRSAKRLHIHNIRPTSCQIYVLLCISVSLLLLLFATHNRILENDIYANIQMSTARCADKGADCHVDICWPSLAAIDAETILANADNFTQ